MKIAVIDIGTNTFNLLIADVNEENFNVLHKQKIGVKLGKGGINKKIIAPDAYERGLDALKEYKEIAVKNKAEKIVAFATSAMRNAYNASDFISDVKEKFGFEIQVISGEREAELIYKGANLAVPFPEDNAVIVDIGGGSVEFIIANKKEVLWKHSFEIGIARLLDAFSVSNPITEEELIKIENYSDSFLEIFWNAQKKYEPKLLIGSSGSFDTFASLLLAEEDLHEIWFKENRFYNFDMNRYKQLHAKLVESTTQQRIEMKGMELIRVDMIVLASIFVNFILKKTGIKNMCQANFALKEGVLSEFMNA